MRVIRHRVCKSLATICLGVVLAASVAAPSTSQQQNKVTQTAGVDNTRMGAYRALAELSFRAFGKGDNATAAELARILERTWDAAEEHGGETSLAKRNESLFEQLDQAMDAFIHPVMQYAAKVPDSAIVEAAYKDFLGKLKQGDE